MSNSSLCGTFTRLRKLRVAPWSALRNPVPEPTHVEDVAGLLGWRHTANMRTVPLAPLTQPVFWTAEQAVPYGSDHNFLFRAKPYLALFGIAGASDGNWPDSSSLCDRGINVGIPEMTSIPVGRRQFAGGAQRAHAAMAIG